MMRSITIPAAPFMSNALHFLQLMCFLKAPCVCVSVSVCECVPLCFRLIIVLNEDVSEIIHECTDESFPVHSQRWTSVIMCIVFHSLQMFSSFRRNSSSASLFKVPQPQRSTHLQRRTIKQSYSSESSAQLNRSLIMMCFDWLIDMSVCVVIGCRGSCWARVAVPDLSDMLISSVSSSGSVRRAPGAVNSATIDSTSCLYISNHHNR